MGEISRFYKQEPYVCITCFLIGFSTRIQRTIQSKDRQTIPIVSIF